MRKLFPGYYRYNEDELKSLWANATFVFDTNVLLNLYTYPEIPREAFWSALEKVSARAWIPYHVALEFHRNKFNRIKQSNKKLDDLLVEINSTREKLSREVRLIELEKRNIGVSDIQERVGAVQEAHDKLSEAVKLACNRLPSVSLDDQIGERICGLFEGRVGNPPSDQPELDALLADGQERFDKKIPPGFEDEKTKGDGVFRDKGITYPRKFGDLIIWKQIMVHAAASNIKDIVFVIGDKKEDWWWKEGEKTIGPLPELIHEMKAIGKVDRFWMYTADQFLQHSHQILDVEGVTDEAIAQVKDIAETEMEERRPSSEEVTQSAVLYKNISAWLDRSTSLGSMLASGGENPREGGALGVLSAAEFYNFEAAVEQWLRHRYGDAVHRTRDFPDFVVATDRGLIGYEARRVRNFERLLFVPAIVQGILRGYVEIHEGRLEEFHMVVVVSEEDVDTIRSEGREADAERRVAKLLSKYPVNSMAIGWIEDEEFHPFILVYGER